MKLTTTHQRTAGSLTTLALALFLTSTAFAAPKLATWKIDADGNWDDSSRWTTASYPDNFGTNLYSASMDMLNRKVSLDTNVTIETFSLSRGILEGTNNPTLMLNQQLHFASRLIGEGLLSANGMTITGATKIVHGWTMENRGVANWLEGDFHVGDGFRFFNNASAGFNANFDGTITTDITGGALFENAGMFRKSAGTNQTKIYIPFLNKGEIEIDSGELAFYSYSTNVGGHIEVLPNASLSLIGQRHSFDANSKITGLGILDFDNGVVDMNAGLDFKGLVYMSLATVNLTPSCTVTQFGTSLMFARSGTLNLNCGEPLNWNSLTMSNGTITGSDSISVGDGGFQWLGGSLIGTGHFDINNTALIAGGTKTIRGWTIENHGALQWLGGDVTTGEGAKFINLPGASVETVGGSWTFGHGGGSFFNNYGVLQKSTGTNFTHFGVPFYNEGLINIASGSMRFGNALTNKGAIAVQSGAALVFQSSNVQLTGLGSVDGDGEVILDLGNVTNTGAFRAAAGVNIKSGIMDFTPTTSRPNFGSTLRVSGGGTLDLGSGYSVGVPNLFQTNSTITGTDSLTVSNLWICQNGDVTGSGLFELRGNSIINSGPRFIGRHMISYGEMSWAGGDIDAGLGLTFHIAASGTFYVYCDRLFATSYGGTTSFLNEGLFRKESAGTNTINVPFANIGMVAINSGRQQFNGGFSQTNGTLSVNTGCTISSTKPFLLYSGGVGGTGEIIGSLYNAALLKPGWLTTGSLKISGNCTQASAATLVIDLATNAYDSLVITGQLNLNGKLTLNLLNGFSPADGSSFPIVTCNSRLGQFSQVTGADLPNGRKLVPVYSANGVSLLVSNTLPALKLTIASAGPDAVNVSWPAGYPDYTLQSCPDISGTNWSNVPSAGTNSCIVPTTTPAQFFRLVKTEL